MNVRARSLGASFADPLRFSEKHSVCRTYAQSELRRDFVAFLCLRTWSLFSDIELGGYGEVAVLLCTACIDACAGVCDAEFVLLLCLCDWVW